MFVLIIDPDQTERRYIAAILASDGFDIVQVSSAVEGMVKATKVDPALVVISEETHPVRVHEAVSVLRRLTTAPLMIVGSGEGGEELASLKGGGDFFLNRPFGAPELAGRARMLIRRAGASKESGGRVPEDRPAGGPPAASNYAGLPTEAALEWRPGLASEAA